METPGRLGNRAAFDRDLIEIDRRDGAQVYNSWSPYSLSSRPQMCLCILWLFFGHRCWEYNSDLMAIFPFEEQRFTLPHYLQHFLSSINRAPTIAETTVSSVLYCRTRGPSAQPFLIVYLGHHHTVHPVVMKLQGFDGPLTVRPNDTWRPYDTRDECSTVTVAYVGQSVRELVGTRRYDVCHTLNCEPRGTITDLLVLAELSAERDRTRAIYPATLFLALQAVCKGYVTSSTTRRAREAPLPSDIAEGAKSAVLDTFPARRRRMKLEIDAHSGFVASSYIQELRAENSELREQISAYKERASRLIDVKS